MRRSRQQSRAVRQLFWMALAVLTLTSAVGMGPASAHPAQAAGRQEKPTVVLVHGAFADSSSWNPVIDQLRDDGYRVVAVANPLRGVKSDADYTASVLKTIQGPIVLVGHSYGGMVISAAANGNNNVKALVYVAGFAPEKDDSAGTLSAKFPGSTLVQSLAPPAPLPGGGKDLYISQDKFWQQFAADVPEEEAKIMAVTQRPVTEAAINDKLQAEPAWKSKPSWFIYGTLDKNIPAQTLAFMAQRAGAKETVSVEGASHVVMISHPQRVAEMIRDAAQS
ncbi:alpha/beta fold hydrolase [Micromonospora sp. URMC 105]|uniref:alpha/beta fold hydrolase n=1 Tax=Micromonospora sp. URMC 105 TaxID=3423413 RepID=UPI003F1BEED2